MLTPMIIFMLCFCSSSSKSLQKGPKHVCHVQGEQNKPLWTFLDKPGHEIWPKTFIAWSRTPGPGGAPRAGRGWPHGSCHNFLKSPPIFKIFGSKYIRKKQATQWAYLWYVIVKRSIVFFEIINHLHSTTRSTKCLSSLKIFTHLLKKIESHKWG